MQLPPERSIEHIIEVKLGESPIKVKPYRYPHHHKMEIDIIKVSPRLIEVWCHHQQQKPICSSSRVSTKEGWIIQAMH